MKKSQYVSYVLSINNDITKFTKTLCENFEIDAKNLKQKNNVFYLNIDQTRIKITFTSKGQNKNLDSALDDQFERLWNYFYFINSNQIDIKINLLHQIKIFRSMIEFKFDIMDKQNIDDIINKIFKFSENYQALSLIDEGKTFVLPNNSILLDSNGKSDLKSFMPLNYESLDHFNKNLTESQIKRKKRSYDILKEKQIFVPFHLPAIEDENLITPPTVYEITKRAISLMIVALYSECLLAHNYTIEKASDFIKPITKRFNAQSFFSNDEKAYIYDNNSSDITRIQFCWKYENCWTLLWALGLVSGDLEFPNKTCDAGKIVEIISNFHSIEEIVNAANLKSYSKLLDEADFINRLDWACVDARILNLPCPCSMDSGVVIERHKTLNWLVGHNSNWDDITTDTLK